jgi:hypothetical protein
MSCGEIEGGGPFERNNVVRLQPPDAGGGRGSAAAAALGAPAEDRPDAITRDGLELLKAFLAIDDAAARAALVALAQCFARRSPTR